MENGADVFKDKQPLTIPNAWGHLRYFMRIRMNQRSTFVFNFVFSVKAFFIPSCYCSWDWLFSFLADPYMYLVWFPPNISYLLFNFIVVYLFLVSLHVSLLCSIFYVCSRDYRVSRLSPFFWHFGFPSFPPFINITFPLEQFILISCLLHDAVHV